MYDSSLRWGGLIGGFGTVIGVLSYALGSVLAPVRSEPTTPEAVAVTVFVRGLLVLAVLGIVLGLAYYAGLRVGTDLLQGWEQQDDDVPSDRLGPALAGGLVMFLYWFTTTLFIYLFPPFGSRDGSPKALLIHVLLGAIFISLGAGLGGLGGRLPVARRLLTRGVVVPRYPRGYLDSTRADVGLPVTQSPAAQLNDSVRDGKGWPTPPSQS